MQKLAQLRSSLTNWKAILGGAVLAAFALALLWVSDKWGTDSPMWLGKVLPSFAAVIGTSGVFAVIYEVLVRREQTLFVLDALALKESLLNAGLTDIATDYFSYPYSQAILGSAQIDLFFLYAETWLNRYSVELTKFLSEPNKSLRLVLPAFDNRFLLPLATHFNYEEVELRQRIANAIAACVVPVLRGGLGTGSTLKVYMHRSHPAYSLYRFDDQMLVGTYYASNARRRAPMFQFSKGGESLFGDFLSDFERTLVDDAQLVFDSEARVDELDTILGDNTPQSLRKARMRVAEGSAGH